MKTGKRKGKIKLPLGPVRSLWGVGSSRCVLGYIILESGIFFRKEGGSLLVVLSSVVSPEPFFM